MDSVQKAKKATATIERVEFRLDLGIPPNILGPSISIQGPQ